MYAGPFMMGSLSCGPNRRSERFANWQMEEQGQFGECHSECRTIARACEEIVGDHDTDIAEELYKVLPGLSPQCCEAG